MTMYGGRAIGPEVQCPKCGAQAPPPVHNGIGEPNDFTYCPACGTCVTVDPANYTPNPQEKK